MYPFGDAGGDELLYLQNDPYIYMCVDIYIYIYIYIYMGPYIWVPYKDKKIKIKSTLLFLCFNKHQNYIQ